MLSKFSVKKPYTVLVGVVMIIVLGIVSFTKMTTDLLPNINLPYVIVMTTYVGASPETVETVVTKPIESSMATVSNIAGISSVSNENYSMVILEFEQDADMNSVSLEIRENLDQIKSYWDDSVGNPIIMKLNPDMLPVMVAAIGREGSDDAEISKYVSESILPDLESIEGVASVSATGLLEESVSVVIRQEKIDEINKQVFGYIDDQMAEKEQEIADGKKEIEDGRAELADAQKELNDSRQKLTDSKTELADGRTELEDGKKKLADGQAELNKQKTETTKKLAETETQLLTAKADLEAAKTSITTQITTIEELQKKLKEVNDGLAKLQQAADGLQQINDGIAQIDTALASIEQVLPGIEAAIAAGQAQGQTLTVGALSGILGEDAKNGVIQLVNTLSPDTPIDDNTTLEEVKVILTAAQAGLQAQRIELETKKTQLLSAVGGSEEELEKLKKQAEAGKAQIENSLDHATMGLGADAYLNTLRTSLTEINNNLAKVDEGLTELYKGNLTAATELANAQTKIDLGNLQMDSAEAQLEAGEAQLEAGEEQIKEGQEQINSGYEQLDEAMEQLADGEEQLAEAKEDAYKNADMTDILTVDTVKSLLTAQNFSMPAGYVTEEGIQYLVRVGDKPETIEELTAMPILNPDMDGVDVITLGDVADIFMTDNSADIYTNINGNPGILITVQKQTGYSTGDVSDKLKDKFDEMMTEDENLSIVPLSDQGIYIDMVMDSIFSSLIFGAVLAILILILFLRDLRPTFIIACSIPISLIAAIVCMYFSGITLNIISLSGLALGVGMLVDNSIVVIENIYRMRGEGKSMWEAAMEGAKEVAGAIMASTLTTVCVFAPIVFTEGITRQLFVDMGLTIAYSLVSSLFIALTVVPAMASKMLRKTKEQKEGKFFTAILRGYEKVLRLSLRFKPIVLIAVVLLLVISAAASVSRGTAFMPEMESTQITVSITMPNGTPLSETAEVTDDVVEQLSTLEDVEDIGAMASSSGMAMLMGAGDAATNATELYITLKEDKKLSGEEIAAEIMELTADITEAEITVNTSSMDMSALGGSGISIQVCGQNIDTLQEIAQEIAAIVESTEGTTEVSDGLEDSSEELRILISRDKAIEHGLTVAQVFQQLAAKLAESSSSTTLETDAAEYDVFVSNAKDTALTRETVKELEVDVTKQDGTKEKVPLTDIASFETKLSPNSINRSEQNRYIAVSAAIADGYNVGLVSQELQKKLDAYEMPEGYTLVMSGENEMINEAMEQVLLMLLLAIIFMYLIMVAQFQSLLSPFIIMFTIPLAFTGGFFGLYFSGSEVSVIALIGFVMLAGIIVNNGIVLVDYTNQLRESGMPKKEALVEAGVTRLRPVLMTALTTILALSTMVFSNDMGAEMSRPMAIVTIGGLIYGTLLTLIVVPCIYDIFQREKKEKRGNMEGLWETLE